MQTLNYLLTVKENTVIINVYSIIASKTQERNENYER